MKPATSTSNIATCRLKRPVCGTTNYYRADASSKECSCCGEPLDSIPAPPLRYADKDIPKKERTFPEPAFMRSSRPEPSGSEKRQPRRTFPEPPPRKLGPQLSDRPQDAPKPPDQLFRKILSRAKAERVPCKVFTINGYCIDGIIAGWDQNVVLVNDGQTVQVMMRSAISTINPRDNLLTPEHAAE